MSELDIYNELFAKIQEKRDEITVENMDTMKVVFRDGDKVLEKWVSNDKFSM